ncbi:MAG: hypothetical protein LBT09_06475 [Planctomycetaceae bacterium]|nr:hypothetical protein [Planctomycetaceae bacterium]
MLNYCGNFEGKGIFVRKICGIYAGSRSSRLHIPVFCVDKSMRAGRLRSCSI